MSQKQNVPFEEVGIVASGAQWAHAHKSLLRDGTLQGGHLSGGPSGPRLFQNSGLIGAEEFAQVESLVSRLLEQPVACDDACGEYLIEIVRADRTVLRLAADSSPEAEALWALLYRQPVGGW